MGTIKENYQMMFTTYPDVVTISQLKEMLSIGITLAYRLVKQNTINAIKNAFLSNFSFFISASLPVSQCNKLSYYSSARYFII